MGMGAGGVVGVQPHPVGVVEIVVRVAQELAEVGRVGVWSAAVVRHGLDPLLVPAGQAVVAARLQARREDVGGHPDAVHRLQQVVGAGGGAAAVEPESGDCL